MFWLGSWLCIYLASVKTMRSISMGLRMTAALSPSTPTDEDSHRPTAPQLCAECHNVLSTDFGLAPANSEGTENEDRVQGDTVASNSTENEGSNNHTTVTRPPTAERAHISTILTVRLFFSPVLLFEKSIHACVFWSDLHPSLPSPDSCPLSLHNHFSLEGSSSLNPWAH